MPWQWGTTGIAYRTDKIKTPIDSWAVFHDAKYHGKMTMMDDGREVIGAFLRFRGHSLNSTDPAELAEAKKDSIEAKKHLKAYISAPVKAQLISGDVLIAQLWNGDTTQAKAEQPNLGYVLPKEGCTIWGDSMCIPKSAPNKRAAHEWMNYILRPEVGAALSDATGYGTPQRRRGEADEDPGAVSHGGGAEAAGVPGGSRQGHGDLGSDLDRNQVGVNASLRGAPLNCVHRTTRFYSRPAGTSTSSPAARCRSRRSNRSSARRWRRTSGTSTAASSAIGKSVTEAGQFAAVEWSGCGPLLQDLLGRQYIDCLGGYGIFSAGVNHPKIVKAVADQMRRMALNSQELLEPWRAALAKLLAMVTPGDLQNAFFINNGTDAIEGAIKLARLYTRRNTFVSTLGGFHGKSMGSLSLMGKASFREPFLGGLQDVRFVPYGDVDALEAELAKGDQVGTPIAAFVVEPVQGEAGGVVPPPDYLPRVREICTAFGTLLIADEIQTGMGRTGRLWGVDHSGVVPDIMCVGKSIGGGVMPLSAFIAPGRIWEVLVPNPIIHSTTFGGNPIACAAGHRGHRGHAGGGSARPGRGQGRVPAAGAGAASAAVSRGAGRRARPRVS